jgi:hypothetical protein
MLSGGKIRTRPSYTPAQTFTPPGRGVVEGDPPDLTPSQQWTAVARLEEGGYLLSPPESYTNKPSFIAINRDGSVKEAGWYVGQNAGTNVVDSGSWPDGEVFESGKATPIEGSFEFKLLYSGKDGETVRMTYREFLDDMQRADYSQDLSYNVAEQDTVSFRSNRMRVHEATGFSIRFEMLGDAACLGFRTST